MNFALSPYPGLPAPAGVRVTGTARRQGAILHISWRLDDPQGLVALPPAEAPARRFALWDATCFEAFIMSPARAGYWELNLSPGGPWNVYHLDGYREGLKEEAAFGALPGAIPGSETSLALDLTPLGLAEAPWRLGIAAVVAERSGHQTFWALAHPGPEPDFHHPEAFTLEA